MKEKTRQEIFVEKGMTDCQRIVLAGAGDQQVFSASFTMFSCLTYSQPGIPAGDVIFVLKASPHESFERSGNDLLTNITITLSEALLGFSRIILTHLDGRGVKMSSPPGKIIKPQDSIVLRGEGMPVYRRPDERGDLYVIFHVEMPDEGWLKSVDVKVSAIELSMQDKCLIKNVVRPLKPYSLPNVWKSIHNRRSWMRPILKRATLSMCVLGLFRLAKTSLTRALYPSSAKAMMMTGKTMMTRTTRTVNPTADLSNRDPIPVISLDKFWLPYLFFFCWRVFSALYPICARPRSRPPFIDAYITIIALDNLRNTYPLTTFICNVSMFSCGFWEF